MIGWLKAKQGIEKANAKMNMSEREK